MDWIDLITLFQENIIPVLIGASPLFPVNKPDQPYRPFMAFLLSWITGKPASATATSPEAASTDTGGKDELAHLLVCANRVAKVSDMDVTLSIASNGVDAKILERVKAQAKETA